MKKLEYWLFESTEGAWFTKRVSLVFLLAFVCTYLAMQMTAFLTPKPEIVDLDYDPECNPSGSYAILYRHSGVLEFYTDDGEIFTYTEIDPDTIGIPDTQYANIIFAYFESHNVLKVVVAHKVIATIDTSSIMDLEYDLGSMFPVVIVNG